MTYTAPDADPGTLAALRALRWDEPEPLGVSNAWLAEQRTAREAIETSKPPKPTTTKRTTGPRDLLATGDD